MSPPDAVSVTLCRPKPRYIVYGAPPGLTGMSGVTVMTGTGGGVDGSRDRFAFVLPMIAGAEETTRIRYPFPPTAIVEGIVQGMMPDAVSASHTNNDGIAKARPHRSAVP